MYRRSVLYSYQWLCSWRPLYSFSDILMPFFLWSGSQLQPPFPLWVIHLCQTRPSKYRIPHLLLFGGVIITPLIAFACAFIDRPPIFLGLFIVASVVFAVIAIYAVRTYKSIPDTGEADAIAWLLKSTSSQDPSLFKNAGQIANKSEHHKALLLTSLLPLLSPLITSRNCHQHEQDLETYVVCLAQLSAFADAEGSFWKNEDAVVHPPFPDTSLLKILQNLQPGKQLAAKSSQCR